MDVQNNRLTTINPLIQQLSKLKMLNLSHNQVSFYPSELSQLFTLTKLDLSYNQIK